MLSLTARNVFTIADKRFTELSPIQKTESSTMYCANNGKQKYIHTSTKCVFALSVIL